jgi:hypothetical protein
MKSPIHSLYWLTAGIIGPHFGAIIGAWIYRLTIFHKSNSRDNNTVELLDVNLKRDSYNTKSGRNCMIEDSDKFQPFIMRENKQNCRNFNDNHLSNDNKNVNEQDLNSNIVSDGTKTWYEINDSSITILSTPKQMQSKSMSSLDSLSDSEKNNMSKNY